MKKDNKILTELQELAPTLAKLDKVNFYQVEEGYFENSQLNIVELVSKAQTEELPQVLASISKKELYAAPAASYFGSFSDDLISKIHAEEVVEELAYALPILQHAPKKEFYKVPATYFSSFPERMTKLVSKQTAESTVEHWSIKWANFTETLLGLISQPRYAFAMASVVSMIVFIGLFINTQTSSISGDDKIFAQMQQIPDADLHHYIAKHRDEFDERTILHNINDVEFIHNFDKPDQVTPHIDSHAKGVPDDDISSEDILD